MLASTATTLVPYFANRYVAHSITGLPTTQDGPTTRSVTYAFSLADSGSVAASGSAFWSPGLALGNVMSPASVGAIVSGCAKLATCEFC